MTDMTTNDISSDISSQQDISPFEWLTSSESILPIVESLLLLKTTIHDTNVDNNNNHPPLERTALHIGCGTSTLGELLISELQFSFVLNIDREETALEYMRQRSMKTGTPSSCLEYRYFDFENFEMIKEIQNFSFILDKGTFDGVLCESLDATVGLLSLVYHALELDGWYILISFHTMEFLLQLLQNLPGAQWNVMEWNKETKTIFSCCHDDDKTKHQIHNMISVLKDSPTISRQDLSIICCQKKQQQAQQPSNLDIISKSLHRDDIRNHIIHVMDQWFQTRQPFLTPERRKELEIAFQEEDEEKSLYECYTLLFTEQERQDLSYEYFLEDWDAYLQLEEVDSNTSTTSMTLKTALHFLQQMQ